MTRSPTNQKRFWRTAARAACVMAMVTGPALAGSELAFPDNQDISDNPGVFTGKDGGFVATVWRDGRRTFSSEQPVPYGVTRDMGYQRQPVYQQAQRPLYPGPGVDQTAYNAAPVQPRYQPVTRPVPPPVRKGLVADMATPE